MKYVIMCLCYEWSNRIGRPIGPKMEAFGRRLELFDSKEEAFNTALSAAEKEVEELEDGCDSNKTFGIPENDEYEHRECVKVECYFDNDHTYTVTAYRVFETKQDLLVGDFYDRDGDRMEPTPELDNVCIEMAKMAKSLYREKNWDRSITLELAKTIKRNFGYVSEWLENITDDFVCDNFPDED